MASYRTDDAAHRLRLAAADDRHDGRLGPAEREGHARRRVDVMDPKPPKEVSVEFLQRITKIMGEDSAAARALAKMDALRREGQDPHCYIIGDTLLVQWIHKRHFCDLCADCTVAALLGLGLLALSLLMVR